MYHFIVNKNASSGQGIKVWNLLEDILMTENTEYEVYFPDNRIDTIRLMKELSAPENMGESLPHFVVVGGDGTLNAVIQGIQQMDQIKLSCIPVGSGNDFARGLGVSDSPVEALMLLLHCPQESIIDYGLAKVMLASGEIKQSRFLISNGVGYDAEICEEVNGSTGKQLLNRLGLGQLSYVIIGLKRILERETCDARITFDGRETIVLRDMFLTVTMNTPFEGGGVPFCPMASWKDGEFDICMVSSLSKAKLLLAIMLVYLKRHYMLSQVNHKKCKKIKIQMKKARWIHLDGDTPCKTKVIELECKQGLYFVI